MPDNLQQTYQNVFEKIAQKRDSYMPQMEASEVGSVISVTNGIARVSGLPGVFLEEIVKFPGNLSGIVLDIDENELGVVILGNYQDLKAGSIVERTIRVMDVPVGDGLLGRVINPLGIALDDKKPIVANERLPIERPAPPIIDRESVTAPLQTGLKVIDALIPIGRGQRELILGDRQTGKTAIALDTIINQKGQDVICVYCAIGQRTSAVAQVIARLREKEAMDYTVVVVAEGNDSAGLQFIAPYASTSIAEYFMGKGHNVLIVYDDLTHHARAYRELSLLLRRPPGREAYPGDIFYIHSRLLERSTHLKKELGGGSLTALPIVETEAQNISAYIPTNLISITDGQIYLSPTLFGLGVLPAVDVNKSVSRVGGKAQLNSYRSVAGSLKLSYAQFEELEAFSRFGTRLDANTKKIIEHGKRIRECLKQTIFHPMSVMSQLTVLLSVSENLFDDVPIENIREVGLSLCEAAEKIPQESIDRILANEEMTESDRALIKEICVSAIEPFRKR